MRARLALVRLSAVAAVVVAVAGGLHTWRHLGHAHSRLTAIEAAAAAPRREHLPVGLFEAWRARVHRGDRWWIETPPGRATGLTNRRGVYRAFATFDFLPAIPASSRSDATVVLHLRSPR